MVGNRLGRDRVRSTLAGQEENRGDDLTLPLFGGQALAWRYLGGS